MGTYGTSRPPTERDTLHTLNGSPGGAALGQLVSSDDNTPVTNSGTAVPFNNVQQGASNSPNVPANMVGTLAGKMLLMQPTAAGCFLTHSVNPSSPQFSPATVQTGINPGPLLGAGERVQVLMKPNEGWISWVSNSSSSATLLVWELS